MNEVDLAGFTDILNPDVTDGGALRATPAVPASSLIKQMLDIRANII